MATFKLGQRVRHVVCEGSNLSGAEGVITGLNIHPWDYAAQNGYGQSHWVHFPCDPNDRNRGRPSCAPF